ncbi:MAG: hypothetical protein HS127_00450 [Planctomycetia bacterium]|nr:hypothetical protein [Planctomycetia bacterium]
MAHPEGFLVKLSTKPLNSKEQPRRSDDCLNRFLEKYYGKTIPKSTLYRHLRLAGATRLKLGVSQQKVRIRS